MPTYKLRTLKGDSFLEHLLHSRGIVDPTEKAAFLSPNYNEGCHDPFLLKDMDKVVDRILQAVEKGEKICIYSDFDADGIPGAVVLHDFFKKISYTNTFHYIPDRHIEGFGIHRPALDQIMEKGATLIISIDCGIAEVVNSAYVKTRGVDLIITDHHTPGEVLPDAFAIINPKQIDCQYPEKMLCGSGVIYKVVQALCQTIRERQREAFRIEADGKGENDREMDLDENGDEKISKKSRTLPESLQKIAIVEGWEKWLLDMVGLATLSDMVPLRGENRIFAHFGLSVLRKSPRIGLIKLFKSLKMNPVHVTEEDIAFMITPRINAASRMGTPMDAFRLLSTDSSEEADALVEHLNSLNVERKTRVALLVKAIKKSIEERDLQMKDVIVVGNPDWQPPVLGLVATSIVRDYGKPVYLWGRGEDGTIKGSCRAPDGFDVVKIMRAIPESEDMFVNMGGHVAAGGFAITQEKIHKFEDAILEAYKMLTLTEVQKGAGADAGSAGAKHGVAVEAEDGLSDENVLGQILVDKVLDPSEVGRAIWSTIEKVGPFGEANPKPLFIIKSAEIMDVKYFGKTKEHLEIQIRSSANGSMTKAIKFFAKEDTAIAGKAEVGNTVDIVVHMEKSMFKSFPEYRLRIVDIL